MTTIIRNVTELPPSERQLYETVLGEHLEQNQRVLVMVLKPGVEPDESVRRKAMADFHELCEQGTANRERLGVSIEEADRMVDEAIAHVRSQQRG